MICCDQCGQWYHGKCLNITEEEVKTINIYICTACKKHGKHAIKES